jgi:tetratricopeptide (TPR) repeat protein
MEAQEGDATKEEGLRLLKAGEVTDAIGVLGRVIASDPDDAQAHMFLGIACHQGGDSPRAAHHLQESIRLQEDPKAYYNLGLVYESSNRADDAKLQYRRALLLDANYSNARQALDNLEAPTRPAPVATPGLDQTQAISPPPTAPQSPTMPPPAAATGPAGPPSFIARQIEEQKKVREAHRALIRSGAIYGTICGAGLFLVLNVLFAYVFSVISIKFAVIYLLTQLGIGAVYGLLIGLWIGYTAGNEMSGVVAGAALGFVYGVGSSLVSGGSIGIAIGVGIFCGVLGMPGGLVIGWMVTNSVSEL